MEVLVTIMLEAVQKVGSLFKFFFHLNLPCMFSWKEGREEDKDHMNEYKNQRKLFQCPGCSDIPLPPIFTCSSGHIVCGPCKKQLESCPQCQGNYDGQARNFVVEAIISSRNFKCRYSDDGCTQVLKAEDLGKHEDKCHFRHVNCNVVDTTNCLCDGHWRGSVSAYYSHLVMVHDILYVFRNKNVTLKARIDPITKDFVGFIQPILALKVVQGKNFLIQSYYDQISNNIFIFTNGLYRDSININNEFQSSTLAQATIKLLAPQTVSLLWTGPVNSVYDTLEEIFEKANGFIIPYEDLIKTAKIFDAIATWDFQIDFVPPLVISSKSKMFHHPCLSTLMTMRIALSKYFQPFLLSGWALIAPIFTILFILFCIIFV